MKRRLGRQRGHNCPTGKTRFRDRASAVRAIANLSRNSTRSTVPARAYECPRCNGWHLTSRATQ